MKFDEFLNRLIPAIKAFVERRIVEVNGRIEQLDAAVKAIPAGPKGDPGERGPVGEPGVRGEKGDPGERGMDGRSGIDGKDGAPGLRGEKGDAGADGRDGAPGVDGKSVTIDDVTPLLEAKFASWALDVERRANDLFQRTAAAMPVPQDGLSVEDFDIEHDGDGTVTFRFQRGALKKEFAIRLPRFKDQGVWREENTYRAGDGVSFGGSFWIAQRDAPEGKPDSGDGHWRLAVKKGRDGKDGK